MAIAAEVNRDHAQRYPQGCRATWDAMCEDCLERLGATAVVVQRRPTGYTEPIRETLARQGRIGTDPWYVEAWMRLEFSTLDHLGGPTWERAVREAAECVDAATEEQSRDLAESYGLR